MNNLEALIEDGGEVTIGREDDYPCVAIATDEDVVAMLVRHDGETLTALLRRLDRAVGKHFETGVVIDEVYDL
ncbi:hypothetical protein [Burkholderia seminalis]|uniref:hypothetical protein n=1 Tax=Burkholderia seminalis TaxID=488731 RepID=UPI0019065107|nr:hypothetical protein [Burkholderia seminalis]MBJ9965627.1 hypothetical protein [Burkholderia seminalis]MDN7592167.1 hypothetical protein [Burkholderia seminalis]